MRVQQVSCIDQLICYPIRMPVLQFLLHPDSLYIQQCASFQSPVTLFALL